jgi:hypothetical protein
VRRQSRYGQIGTGLRTTAINAVGPVSGVVVFNGWRGLNGRRGDRGFGFETSDRGARGSLAKGHGFNLR